MNEPGLEFVWVGDDAIDPLEQAQTLQILVGAGIKTREEARADLGLAPAGGGAPWQARWQGWGSSIRITTSAASSRRRTNAAGPVGSPAQAAATPVQVASNDAMMSDAIVDGGTADEGAVAQTSPGAGADGTPTASARSATENDKPRTTEHLDPDQQAPTQGMPIIHDVPDDAVSLYGWRRNTILCAAMMHVYKRCMPHGRAHWQDPVAATSCGRTLWDSTIFTKRSGRISITAYTDASNYAVGVYMAGAGYSYNATARHRHGFFANLHSSNRWLHKAEDLVDKGLE